MTQMTPDDTIVVLTAEQRQQLKEALLSAFPRRGALRQLVDFKLDQNLETIAGGENLDGVVYSLIDWARARGRLGKLILGAYASNDSNPDLRSFIESIVEAREINPADANLRTLAEQVNLAPKSLPQGELEKLVLKSVKFANNEQWRSAMSICELTVCRIEIPRPGIDSHVGTGFLLGPSLVMTNAHLVQKLIDKQQGYDPQKVVLLFDYKTMPDGKVVNKGQPYRLADKWLLDSSPENELDYALLRVEGIPGKDHVGGRKQAPQRGWLKPQSYTFQPGEPIFIIQHPKAETIKFAPGFVIRVEPERSYIYYSTNTDDGSSGAPCFNSDWELVALHHWGEEGVANRGVIFLSILARLKKRKKLGLLGEK